MKREAKPGFDHSRKRPNNGGGQECKRLTGEISKIKRGGAVNLLFCALAHKKSKEGRSP